MTVRKMQKEIVECILYNTNYLKFTSGCRNLNVLKVVLRKTIEFTIATQ